MTLLDKKIEALNRLLNDSEDWIATPLKRDIELELATISELITMERETIQKTFQTAMRVDSKGMPYWCPPSCKEPEM